MNYYNKKYNLNEGRVIGNNIINYGGFPKNINEVNEPTVITAQTSTNSNGAGGPAPGIPAGPPPGVYPTDKPVPPPGNSQEWIDWWWNWQKDNQPKQIPGESRPDFLIRWQQWLDLWERMQQWFVDYGNGQRVN
jgi:hypothetical protein